MDGPRVIMSLLLDLTDLIGQGERRSSAVDPAQLARPVRGDAGGKRRPGVLLVRLTTRSYVLQACN